MSTSSFRQFSLLPTELRLQIWLMAVRPSDVPGLHYLRVIKSHDSTSKVLEEKGNSYKGNKQHGLEEIFAVDNMPFRLCLWSGCRSAQRWDQGLWTTNHEARRVIEEHHRTEYTPPAEDSRPPISLPTTEGYLMIHPQVDLFCLSFEPGCKQTFDWEDLSKHLPFSGYYNKVQNLAINFDPSWNEKLPMDIDDLINEDSARGFVADAVAANASSDMNINVWLLDRGVSKGLLKSTLDGQCSFHDLDREYYEMNNMELYELHHDESTAAHFFMHLIEIGAEYYDACYSAPAPGHPPPIEYNMSRRLGILVCLDEC